MWREGLRRSGMDERTIDRACDAIADQFVPWQESTFPGLLGNVIAGRIANRFDLGGTNCALDAACASSLAALSMAMAELRSGHADTILTGGVDALNDMLMFLCFSQTPALSLTGDCRPFSDQADGTMLGEGVAMLALRRLEDAERDGHRIYAVLRGLGSSSDGRAKSVYAPRPEGQSMALRRTYEDAGYSPTTVGLVEAHGTGTVAGDAAEFAALREVFREAAPSGTQWCALGSVKSQIGHTKAAAGAASLVKAVLALHHRTLPPTIKVQRPNPALQLETSPFYLNTGDPAVVPPRRSPAPGIGQQLRLRRQQLPRDDGGVQRARRRRRAWTPRRCGCCSSRAAMRPSFEPKSPPCRRSSAPPRSSRRSPARRRPASRAMRPSASRWSCRISDNWPRSAPRPRTC